MFGPGLALRGPEGPASMHKAIEVLQKESKVCFVFFMLSLLAFHISSFLLVWIYYPGLIAFVVNVVLLAFLIVFVTSGLDIFKKLYVPDNTAVTGQFVDFSTYDRMPDLEKISRQQELQQQHEKLAAPQAVGATPADAGWGGFDLGVLSNIKNIFS
jgi:hypothetical protein